MTPITARTEDEAGIDLNRASHLGIFWDAYPSLFPCQMLDQLGALTVLQAAKTAHHPAHSPHIVKSVQQVLDTYAIVEVCQLYYTVLYMDLSHCRHRASKPNRLPVVTTALLEFSKSWHPME